MVQRRTEAARWAAVWAFALVLGTVAAVGCRPTGGPEDPTRPRWVTIPAGSYAMGSPAHDPEHDTDEVPQHEVRIAAFEMSETEVTVAHYRACVEKRVCTPPATVDGCNWGVPNLDAHPVNCVDWLQARTFCAWAGGRLATEAEWEYAGRGGTTTSRYGPLDRIAWYQANSGGRTQPVGKKQPNDFGLYDMLGNVSEWVEDCYHTSYAGAPTDGSAWVFPCGPGRVLRGSSWWFRPRYVRISSRDRIDADIRTNPIIGFRCAAGDGE